jgi:glycosyltransferase involved in cell wall biosynthesis
MFSVIVPAHNEAQVIEAGLRSMTQGFGPDELEIIVVCNGCRDDTARLARGFGPIVKVIETDVASKSHALNLGDQAALGMPRLYVDADVVLTPAGLRAIVEVLESGAALAAAPTVETVILEGTSLTVRQFYRVWMSLPYVNEGMVGAGVYALSREGRARFGAFPSIIADDGYIRLLFRHGERVKVAAAVCKVRAPKTLGDLIKIKTRSRLGVLELAQTFPELYQQSQRNKGYAAALGFILARPSLYLGLAPYLWVTLYSKMRAKRQAKTLGQYAWERDNSSRVGVP